MSSSFNQCIQASRTGSLVLLHSSVPPGQEDGLHASKAAGLALFRGAVQACILYRLLSSASESARDMLTATSAAGTDELSEAKDTPCPLCR